MTEALQEQPADSIADTLSAAFDAADGIEDTTEEVVEETPVEAAEEATQAPAEAVSEGEEGEGTGEPIEEPLTAPDHWSAEDKETFNSAPRNVQEWALNRHKAMEADYTRKTQEISDFKKTWSAVSDLFAGYRPQLRAAGMTEADAVARLINADQMLRSSPQSGIQQIAQMYGIDLSQFAGPQIEVDPQVQALQGQIAQLQNHMMTQQQQEAQMRQNSVLSEIESFAAQTGEDGAVSHPHFNEVVEEMIVMAQAERAAGREPKLDNLYEQAVWANPTIREKMLAASKEAEQKKAEEEARAKAAKAAKAGKSVKGSPGGATPSADLSLRAQLEQSFG